MPATIVSNTELAQGGIVLTQHSYNADEEGGVLYSANYVCLTQFDTRNAPLFAKGANPPKPLPETMSSLRMVGTPRLSDVTIQRQNGLTYFNATYATAVRGVYTETENEVWKVFSKSVAVPAYFNIPAYTVTTTFDYVSKTVSTNSKSGYVRTQNVSQLVGPPTNVVSTRSNPNIFGFQGALYSRPSEIVTRSRSRAASGQTTYTLNLTGIYV
jgi:hypothetical protein